MSKSKYTPGNWQAHLSTLYPATYDIFGEDGTRIAVVGDGTANDDACEPDARLIAAAPELLAALEAGYSDLRTRLIEHAQVAFLMPADDAAQYVEKAWPVLEQMRAAIAKATGAVQRETMPDGTTVSFDLSDW